ncbi:MAG: hypothetical protein ACXWYO_05130 [Gaiellaceae bacterium]
MVRRLGSLLVVVGVLAIVQSASAAFPAPFAVQGGAGLPSLDGSLHFVTLKTGAATRIAAVEADAKTTVMSRTVAGSYGIAMLTQNGLAGGLFRDGSAFVLQSIGLKPTSRFMIVGAKDLIPRATIALKGIFGFDALSPDGSMLYLIQHTSTQDLQHYIVRAYDLKARKLLPGRVADKTQRSWVMQGWAVDRVTSPNGRWVYTLYSNPGGYPFVHALDTVRGVAHCIGVPWRGDQNEPWNMRLALDVAGTSLAVNRGSGVGFVAVDLSSWKVSYLSGTGG